MKIPFSNLTAQFEGLQTEIMAAVNEVLLSQQCIQGPAVRSFELAMADFLNVGHAIGVSSGTDALLVSLMALGIKPGDEIITTPFSFIAPIECIIRLGAIPVFVDIDPQTFLMDEESIEDAITDRTRALLPVHLFGQMADMQRLLDLARKYDLAIVEDAAQSIGATDDGKFAGTMGDLGCFSFFPSKNLGGAGDGGMVVTNSDDLAERVRMLGRHGAIQKYIHAQIGGNFRLDSIQAAILNAKLPHLNTWTKARRKVAAYYDEALKNCDIVLPVIKPDNEHVFNQYCIRVANNQRDNLQFFLREHGIETAIYYPIALHQQPCLQYLGYDALDFPHARKACDDVLALPIYPELTAEQLSYIADTINAFKHV